MTKAKYPYPTDKGWSRKEVVAYLVNKGAKYGQAERWTRDSHRIPSVGNFSWWNGMGFIYSAFFDELVIRKITRRTIAKWRREEAKARIKRRNRNMAKRKALSAAIKSVKTAPVIVLDTATTGILGNHEIIELAIVSSDGNILFNSRFRPVHHKTWPDASKVNGIYWKDVANEYPISFYRKIIKKIIDAADKVIGYNISFDAYMLRNAGIYFHNNKCVDVMDPFAEIYGEWHDYFENYIWQSLGTCAAYYGYDWGTAKYNTHSALDNALATLYCWKQMNKNLNND